MVTAILQAEIRVHTRFEPPRVAVGSTSKYIVEIVETDNSNKPIVEPVKTLPIPSTGGLNLRNGRTSSSQSTKIINGARSYNSTQQLIIDAVAPESGSFSIPEFIFEYKGARLQAPAATLEVVARSADATPTIDELIFLTTDAPDQLYVGETTPITLKLYVSSTVQMRGLNAFERTADGFTISDLPEESNETTEMLNGRRYRVYSWPLIITPISSGQQDLNFQFTLSAQMPDQRNATPSPFGQSIFDNFFGRTERFNVYTEPTQIDVRRLPAEGRPDSFSGAIGMFNMQVTADSDSTRVGEPIMLSLKVSGQGNFDRIKSPDMPATSGWRNYEPEAAFDQDSSNPRKGMKRFDYVFIPEKAGSLKLPEVKFSYFDPSIEKYVELSAPILSAKVAPSNRPVMTTAAPLTEEDSAPAINLTKALSSEELLITLDYRPRKGRQIEKSLLSSPWFNYLNCAAFIVLTVSGIVIYRRKQLYQNADYALAHQAKQALKLTVKEAQSNDAAVFYRSAQQAIRLAATVRTKRNLRSADLAKLEAQFKQSQVADGVIEQARSLFKEADNHRFSGRTHSADLQRARTQLNTILKAL
jgi:hypothetical protein